MNQGKKAATKSSSSLLKLNMAIQKQSNIIELFEFDLEFEFEFKFKFVFEFEFELLTAIAIYNYYTFISSTMVTQ